MRDDYKAAAAYLIADGFYGPFSPAEWADCDDREVGFGTRGEAIDLVNMYADRLTEDEVHLLREVYGRFPI